MGIYITGSMAYDRIMNFPGQFSDHILPEKIHILNVSFWIDHMQEKRGGTGGNIAYTLALLGEKPRILASVGKDFGPYEDCLKDLDLPLDGLRRIPDTLTAGAYITTDKDNNQITGFYAAAMLIPCEYSFDGLNAQADLAIISPTNKEDMIGHARFYKQKGLRYIFDPGQQIPVFNGEELLEVLSGAFLLASNDYELEMILKACGRTRAELAGLVGAIVTTLGDRGSLINRNGDCEEIGVARPLRVQDPTGAGDAFRAGLIKGIIHGLPLGDSARLGAVCASFCVEHYGTQEHCFTPAEFKSRHQAAFGRPVEF